MDPVSFICIFSSLPSTKPFGSLLASSSVGTPKLSEFVREQSHMSDPLGGSRVSSQKQNREGVVGAQNGQYHATVESSSGCSVGPDRNVTYYTLIVFR